MLQLHVVALHCGLILVLLTSITFNLQMFNLIFNLQRDMYNMSICRLNVISYIHTDIGYI